MKNKETLEKLRTYQIGVIRSVIASRQGRLGTYCADEADCNRLADTGSLDEEYYDPPLTIKHDGLYRNVIALEFHSDGQRPVCLMDGEDGDDFPVSLDLLSTDTLQSIIEWLEEYGFIPSADAAPQTTSDLTEDFVERCLPEYPTRYDVFRLGELQNFLDGHDAPELGLKRDEAAAERDRLQLRIYAEAIAAFMKRQPTALPGNVSLRHYAEALVDIAYEAGRKKFRPSDNSRDTAATIIAWGDEFSRQHEDTDWTEKEYLDEICSFTAAKLRSVPSKDDPNAEFDIAFLNRKALERHGYDTATITDGDLQELAGRMGDYYCDSSFSEHLYKACSDFGLQTPE